MKKTVWGAALALLLAFLSFPTLGFSSDFVKAHLFPVQLTLNGKPGPLFPILNYEGSAYTPIRATIEQMGGQVAFDEDKMEIAVSYPATANIKSEVSSIEHAGDFHLLLHSKNKVYKEGEPVLIWGTLIYTGEEAVEIGHGDPLIFFTIKDREGTVVGQPVNDILAKTMFAPHNEQRTVLPADLVVAYNWIKAGMPDDAEFARKVKIPWALPAGEYTIGVASQFQQTGKDQTSLFTEIQITVEK